MVKIELTLGELFKAKDSFVGLYSCKIDVHKAFQAKQTLKKVNELLETLFQSRNDIIQKYGVDLGGGNFSVPSANKAEYEALGWTLEQTLEANKKMGADFDILFAGSIEVDVVEIELDDLKGSKLSPIDMENLEKFIKN